MPFVIKDETGKINKRKTAMLKKKLEKACQKITKTVFEEITSFHNAAEAAGVVDESFKRAAAHRAMLELHKSDMDVFLSAEFGDLFGTPDAKDPLAINTWVDIDRIEKARDKWVLKNTPTTK